MKTFGGTCEQAEMDLLNDWRTTNRGAVARARYLLSSGLWSDCKFLVGEPSSQEFVAAHKLPLVSSSPVFEAMFFGSIPVGQAPIQVPDIEAETFRAMLEFVYTDQPPSLHVDLALDLCYCAKKYMLPDLANTCTNYLLSNITPENVCEIHTHAKLLENPELMGICLKVMRAETKKVLASTSWADADMPTVSLLLGQKYLVIDTELDLYGALLVWSKAECTRKSLAADKESLRSVAAHLLGKIRFLTLTPEEFTNGPGTGEILEQDEIVAIFLNKFSDVSRTPMPEGFSIETTRRLKPDDDEQIGCATQTSVFLSLPIPPKISQTLDETEDCYCYRDFSPTSDFFNDGPTLCRMSCRVDAKIEILGLLIPTQVMSESADSSKTYSERLYARLCPFGHAWILAEAKYLGDAPYNKILVMRFDRPVTAETHTDYQIDVIFKRSGIYPSGSIEQSTKCEQVTFAFYHKRGRNYMEQLIRGIVFVKSK